MIVAISFVAIFMLMLVIFHISNRTAAQPNGNLLLGVTLPYDALKDAAVEGIINRFKKSYSLISLAFAALVIPMFFISSYIAISLMYMLVYIVGIMYVNQKNIAKHSSTLYTLKKEREWWTGERNIISVDTELSRLRDTFPISKGWFAFPFGISAFPIIFGVLGAYWEAGYWLLQLCGVFTLIVFYLIYLAYTRARSVVYCENTEINITLNRIFKKEWTRCFVIIAAMNSAFFVVLTYLLSFSEAQGSAVTTVSIVFSCIVIFPMILAQINVRKVRNRFMRLVNEEVYVDEDEYWVFGAMFYNNPNDSRSMVEKRIGYGMTANLASWLGKVTYAVIVAAIGFWICLTVYLLPLDFGSVTFSIDGQVAAINAPMMDYSFSTEDIVSVSLMDDIPIASKVHGGDSPRFYVGRFFVYGYGESHVYVHRNTPPYIAVELPDGWLFFNGSSKETTERYFSVLNR